MKARPRQLGGSQENFLEEESSKLRSHLWNHPWLFAVSYSGSDFSGKPYWPSLQHILNPASSCHLLATTLAPTSLFAPVRHPLSILIRAARDLVKTQVSSCPPSCPSAQHPPRTPPLTNFYSYIVLYCATHFLPSLTLITITSSLLCPSHPGMCSKHSSRPSLLRAFALAVPSA